MLENRARDWERVVVVVRDDRPWWRRIRSPCRFRVTVDRDGRWDFSSRSGRVVEAGIERARDRGAGMGPPDGCGPLPVARS